MTSDHIDLCFICFRPGGILVCKLEGASFWEKTTGADYLPHNLTLPEGIEKESIQLVINCIAKTMEAEVETSRDFH